MQLNDIFEKPIDRRIEGVIKADDNSRLLTEVEEYVLTNEIEKRLEEFLGAYNNYENANGGWISGFFGSGKSHLLKMLALLLENREIDGIPILDRFLPKCGDNEFLRGELTRATAIPSKSILFNIDQKADIISKTEIDALLSVFMKVFDEICGYYGKQGHIAQMERDLDKQGLLDAFKSAYLDVSGQPWEKGREMAILESENIDKAHAKVAGGQEHSVENIVERYRASYSVSIEDFAQQVRNYIDQQVPGFRLNFFVDEVGQYIAESQKLRLNLQTIAESLATKCGGQAWIVVTAQEDMESLFGESGGQQTNDYSRIQARFAYRMKLTSSDVAEVIQKRLLMKTEASTPLLEELYNEQVNNFETLFAFADGAQTYRNYRDRERFVSAYPFVPYQFTLFQFAIQDLSAHNAFEGKHSSTGERSMLGVFQQVAVKIEDRKIGQLAPFDLMFEGIRTSLKSHIQQAILTAETHLNNEFAVRVLKALFLVKYIKSFRPTVRNLRVLMLEAFDCDLPALRESIQDALNVLEQQTYIE
ncbi:MAG TPA: BREX system P-loop protein BrxC, partial [Bacteroidetes bacterium]|nr:BREX system P-loop protein BrxC [Bacteroidota bacterium]HEX04448.1 BREX system P-loop protein BrxC [Bacteroidota bacterium]